MLDFQTLVDGSLNSHRGDGIVIATATGSTAHARPAARLWIRDSTCWSWRPSARTRLTSEGSWSREAKIEIRSMGRGTSG